MSALELFPNDRRVRCEGTLTVQNLSFTEGGARALAKAGVAPVIIRLLQAVLVEAEPDSETGKETNGRNAHVLAEGSTNGGERLDREGKSSVHDCGASRLRTARNCGKGGGDTISRCRRLVACQIYGCKADAVRCAAIGKTKYARVRTSPWQP